MGKRPHRAAVRAAKPTGLKHQDHRGRTCIWRATTIRPSGRHPAHRHSKVEVDVRQRLHAVELDLELGGGVGVVAGADDRVAARGEVAELPGAGQRRRADPAEGLVAGDRGVGVDAHEVDVVDEMVEVGDHVALVAADRAVGHGVEVVEVAAAAAGEGVLAEPALELVVEAVALERVAGGGADRPLDPGERVGLAAALGRVGGEAEVDRDLGRAAEE